MAEIDDKLDELTSQLGSLAKNFSNVSKSFDTLSGDITRLGRSLTEAINTNKRNLNEASQKFKTVSSLLSQYGDLSNASMSQLQKIANTLGRYDITKSLNELEDVGAKEEDLNEIREKLLESLTEYSDLQKEAITLQKEQQDELSKSILQETLLSNALSETNRKLKLWNKTTTTTQDRMMMVGDILLRTGIALTTLRDTIYKVQQQLGTTFATAGAAFFGDLFQVVASYFREGPALAVGETRDAIKAFQDEFGVILRSGEAGRIAQQAKALGTSAVDFVKAQRAFLGAGGVAGATSVQQQFITQFRAAGLTANQALVFAAKNANLVAIAGVKYADALARAAANATRIGVSLDKTEEFANNLVGDFEGALERFSELRAMGVEVDFNKIAAVAATGTPEEIVKELSSQLGGNKALLEEVQRNRFLKVAIERDLGLSIADVKRLAGVAGTPEVQTTQEKNEQSLTEISKWLPIITKSLGLLITVIGASKGAELGKTLATAGGALGTLLGGPGVGTAIGGLIGGGLAYAISGLGKASGGLITGPGTSTSDNILTPTSPGEYVVNARATSMYGADMLDRINSGTFVPSTPPVNNVVNMNTERLEAKLDRVVTALGNIKIDMDGNTVGRVSLNARSPLDRLSVAG